LTSMSNHISTLAYISSSFLMLWSVAAKLVVQAQDYSQISVRLDHELVYPNAHGEIPDPPQGGYLVQVLSTEYYYPNINATFQDGKWISNGIQIERLAPLGRINYFTVCSIDTGEETV
jgi:hypothetical protein